MRFMRRAACAAIALALGGVAAVPVAAADVKVPLVELGYRDGVTAAGVAPRVTFDLPRYAALRSATAHLELHVSAEADPASTISIAVNGATAYTKSLAEIGHDTVLDVPLPIPPPNAQLFVITVSGALRVTGDPCANNSARKLFMRLGRDSALLLRTAGGGTAEAFFRDYRGAIAVSGLFDDPQLVALPYTIDRLEPWHRITATLVAKPPKTGRAIDLVPNAVTSRTGDVLRISPAAFAALPVPQGETTLRANGSIAFGDLHQHLGSASGTGDLAFDVALKGSITGGMPQHLAVHAVVQHSALPPNATGTIQVLVNGLLTGARELYRDAGVQTVNVDVPQSTVGPSNSVRILVATDIPPGACSGADSGITASLLDSSTFTWSGVVRKPPTIESFLTALNGRVVVLVAPEFHNVAFHMLGSIGRLNAAITQLDVKPYTGTVPGGYDFAIVYAPPGDLDNLHLPVRPSAPAFAFVNPTDDAKVFRAAADSEFALLQLGDANGTPVLAITYHGSAAALRALERTRAAQLATQVADVSVVGDDGVTTYDVGEKLRPRYPGELTAADIWSRAKLGVAIALLILIVLGGRYAARRLTGRTI
jgi:hypothetical protein